MKEGKRGALPATGGQARGPYREGRVAAPLELSPRTMRSCLNCRSNFGPHSKADGPQALPSRGGLPLTATSSEDYPGSAQTIDLGREKGREAKAVGQGEVRRRGGASRGGQACGGPPAGRRGGPGPPARRGRRRSAGASPNAEVTLWGPPRLLTRSERDPPRRDETGPSRIT